MKQKRKKKETNLGFSLETKFLVTRYRMLKYLERASHRIEPKIDMDEFVEEEFGNSSKEIVEIFTSYAFSAFNDKAHNVEYYRSDDLSILGALYRAVQKRGLIEEAVAKLVYFEFNYKEPKKKDIKNYVEHLRYYRNHPEIHREYKLK